MMEFNRARPYIVTIALAAIALVVSVPVNAGFVFTIFVPFIFVSLIYNLVSFFRKPEQRRLAITRISIWLAVPAIVAGAHWYWYKAARADADFAVTAIVNFKARTGSWPRTLEDAGIQDPHFGESWKLGYLCKSDRPSVIYAATSMIFDTYGYDFDAKQWIYYPD